VLGITTEPLWKSMQDRGWDTASWVSDSSKLEERLGWRPTIDLEHGLQLTADWLSTNPSMNVRYRAASS
jgi:dTDP-D-glucose 4,6-dehydratase